MANHEGKVMLTYVACAVLTSAWVWDADWSQKKSDGTPRWDGADAIFSSALAGAGWPVYWSGKGALFVIRTGKAAWQNAGCEVKVPS